MELTMDKQMERVVDADQYTLWQILGLLALVAIPMPILSYVIAPAFASATGIHPGIARWLMITVGLAWLFVVSAVMLYLELGTLRWSVVRKRTWYRRPRDPKTGEPKARLLWWALPAVLLNALVTLSPISALLDGAVTTVFPFLAPPATADMSQLVSPEFVGQWWLLGIVLVSSLFNYFLGEELFFRGVLLPKMNGVFGRWDWLANAAFFALWHLHMPWHILTIVAAFAFAAWASRRFRSNWIFFIAHGVDGVFTILMVLAVVTGLAV
jgi:membrane protease YdiL (CAAX protease family)